MGFFNWGGGGVPVVERFFYITLYSFCLSLFSHCTKIIIAALYTWGECFQQLKNMSNVSASHIFFCVKRGNTGISHANFYFFCCIFVFILPSPPSSQPPSSQNHTRMNKHIVAKYSFRNYEILLSELLGGK